MIAPFVPFYAEELWKNLNQDSPLGSVHFQKYPEFDNENIDKKLSDEILLARDVCSIGHSARSGAKIKTRQPLQKVYFAASETFGAKINILEFFNKYGNLIRNELNVREIVLIEKSDLSIYVDSVVKPNFKSIGSKFKNKVPLIKESLQKNRYRLVDGVVFINDEDEEIVLTSDDVQVSFKEKDGFAAASDKGMTLILDVSINQELKNEYIAREFSCQINAIRAKLSIAYDEVIEICFSIGSKEILDAFLVHKKTIEIETLTKINEAQESDLIGEINVNDCLVKVYQVKLPV